MFRFRGFLVFAVQRYVKIYEPIEIFTIFALNLTKNFEAMDKRLILIVAIITTLLGLNSCGSSSDEDIVGVANNPTQFFGCSLGDDSDDVIEQLKDAKTYKVTVNDKANPVTVTLTGKRKGDALKWRNTNYDRAVLDMSDDVFTAIELTKAYANKGAMTKYVNRQDALDDADITKTDSTRTYIIKGEESRCSIAVNIPSRVVNITYTDNRVWVKPSTWERIVNFVCNPFDNVWSLLMWAVILGLGYLVYKRYQTQITQAIEEAQNSDE